MSYEVCGIRWTPKDNELWAAHECKRPPGHEGRHVCVCASWADPEEDKERP